MNDFSQKNDYILWLDGVYSYNTLTENQTISPASNFWKLCLIKNLSIINVKSFIVCCPPERCWPFGKLIVNKNDYDSIDSIKSIFISYLNFPFLRKLFKYFLLKRKLKSVFKSKSGFPKFIVTWSCQGPNMREEPEIKIARYLKNKFKINWLCLIGEGITPPGATHYMYSCWYSYQHSLTPSRSYYLDGGVPDFDLKNLKTFQVKDDKKIFLYSGSLSIHGGALELATAFHNIPNKNIELIICGGDENTKIEKLSKIDPRIKIKGYLSEDDLNKLASKAYAFVNPRPISFKPNLLNFPSKLLFYFAFEKPVLSTISPGMSPEICDAVIPIKSEKSYHLIEAIDLLLSLTKEEYDNYSNIIRQYKYKNLWPDKTIRFKNWLYKI